MYILDTVTDDHRRVFSPTVEQLKLYLSMMEFCRRNTTRQMNIPTNVPIGFNFGDVHQIQVEPMVQSIWATLILIC